MIVEWFKRRTPLFFAAIAFGGGIVLMASGATPSIPSRLELTHRVLPVPMIELSHFAGSVAGIWLLILAWGLRRRIRDAYVLSCGLLAAGCLLLLLKGLEYGPALVLLVLLLILRVARGQFHRRASLLSEPFTLSWLIAIGLVLAGTTWLLFFSYRNVPYSNSLWWEVELLSDAPRSLRAGIGVVTTVIGFALLRLLRAVSPKPGELSDEVRQTVARLVAQHGAAEANLALLGDKHYVLNDRGSAFIMYGISGRSWVAMGDPVGTAEDSRGLVREFSSRCREHDRWPVFYQASEAYLGDYLDAGLAVVKIGEQGRVPLAEFTGQGKAWEDVRYRHRRCAREGCEFEVVSPAWARAHVEGLRIISEAWLASRRERELGFSLGRFDPEYIGQFPVALVRRQGHLIAFATIWLSSGREEVEVDIARYLPDAPPGIMYFIMLELMRWAKAGDVRWLNLGMAPLAGLESSAARGFWGLLGGAIFQWGESFYKFRGLRQFKNKFNPIWRPRYLVSPGGLVLPSVIANIAALIRRRSPRRYGAARAPEISVVRAPAIRT